MDTVLSLLKPRQELVLENLVLRHQIMVLKRSAKRPHLTKSDRLSWVVLSKIWGLTGAAGPRFYTEDCRIDQNGADYQTLEQRLTNKSAQTVLQWP